MWILHCFRILMITFREIIPKYLKICREYSLNMAEAADFSMPDAFAKEYLDRIIKKICLHTPLKRAHHYIFHH
jgi:hypothetical protein